MAAEFESADLAFDSLLDADADAEEAEADSDDDVQIIEPDEEEKDAEPSTDKNNDADAVDFSPSLPEILLGEDAGDAGKRDSVHSDSENEVVSEPAVTDAASENTGDSAKVDEEKLTVEEDDRPRQETEAEVKMETADDMEDKEDETEAPAMEAVSEAEDDKRTEDLSQEGSEDEQADDIDACLQVLSEVGEEDEDEDEVKEPEQIPKLVSEPEEEEQERESEDVAKSDAQKDDNDEAEKIETDNEEAEDPEIVRKEELIEKESDDSSRKEKHLEGENSNEPLVASEIPVEDGPITTEDKQEPIENEVAPIQDKNADSSESEPTRRKGCTRRRNATAKASTDGDKVDKTIFKCTCCSTRLHVNRSVICAHPVLRVIVCEMCLNYYNSGSFSSDSAGTDEQCRWCAEGGKLLCCDVCTNAFCQSCIRREFGPKELSSILKAPDWRCYVCDPSPLADKVALCESALAVKRKMEEERAKGDVGAEAANSGEGGVRTRSIKKPKQNGGGGDSGESEKGGCAGKDGAIKLMRKWVDSIRESSSKLNEWAVAFGERLDDFKGPERVLLADVTRAMDMVHVLRIDTDLLYECFDKKNNVRSKLPKDEERGKGTDAEPEKEDGSAVKVEVESDVGDENVTQDVQENGEERKKEGDSDDSAATVKVGGAKDQAESKSPKSSNISGVSEEATSSEEGPRPKSRKRKDKSPLAVSTENDLAKKVLLKVLDESEDSGRSSSGRQTVRSTDDDDTDMSLLRKSSPRKTKKTPERIKKKANFTPSSESDRDEVGIGRLRGRAAAAAVHSHSDPKLAAQVRVVLEKLPLGGDQAPAAVATKKRRLLMSSSDSDSLGRCVAKLADLSGLKGGRAKKKRCPADSAEGQETPKKDTGKKKRKKGTSSSDASDPIEEEDGCDSTVASTEDEFQNAKGKTMCENDYAKEKLADDLRDNSSHGNSSTDSEATVNAKRNVKAKREVRLQSGDEEDGEEAAAEEGDGDGDAKRKKSKAKDKLLRIPLEEKTSKASDSDGPPVKDFKIKKRRRLAVSSDDSGKKGASGGRRATASSSDSDSDAEAKRLSSRNQGRKIRKRRRIINVNSSSDGSDDSDRVEKGDTPGGKGRKNIRKLIKDKKLADDTKTAAKEEEDRKKRIAELQKLYNVVVEAGIGDHASPITTRLILEVDKDTEQPLIEVHPKLIRKLKPHQVDGVKFLWASVIETLDRLKEGGGSGCMLAHCMGLGKTLQVITFIHTLLSNPMTELNTCLVVCPLNTVINWSNEFTLWIDNEGLQVEKYELAGSKSVWKRMDLLQRWQEDGGVMIMGYEMFRLLAQEKGKRFSKRQKEVFHTSLIDPGPDVVVCDEGHILKNDLTALSKAMNRIRTRRRIVLTGTPLQNNLVEYHCMVNFVKPNLLGNLREFRNRFANPISNGQCADSTIGDVRLMKRRAHILHNLLDGCVQRQDYGVLTPFLPPKQEYVISVRLSELQITLYRHYLSNLAQRGRGSGLFADYQNLMKIWTHPTVLKMAEIRDMNKASHESEDSFIDDDSSDNSESSRKVSDSDDDVVCLEDGKAGGSGLNALKAGRSTRSKNAGNSSDEEVINTWKTRSRSQRGAKDEEPEAAVQLEDVVHGWWTQFVDDKDLDKVTLGGKLVILLYILRECEAIGDKILIFSQSLLSLDLIEQMLRKCSEPTTDSSLSGFAGSWSHGLDYFRMDGSTSPEMRNKWTNIFNDPDNLRARLFLISTRAGSLGINLVSANRVIIFDASWNPTHDVQSIFRVYRFGQEKPVYVYRLLAQGTMEEKIYDRQVTKQSLACRVVDEKQIERHFNAADLQELYMFTPEIVSKRPIPMVPKDRLLAELLIHQKDWIVNYHEHDSLLENRPEEVLTEEERKAAWEEYEAEKKGLITKTGLEPNAMLMAGQNIDFMRIKAAILERDPGITSEELAIRLQAAINVLRNYEIQQQQQSRQQQQQQQQQAALPRVNFPLVLQAQMQNVGQQRRPGSIPDSYN